MCVVDSRLAHSLTLLFEWMTSLTTASLTGRASRAPVRHHRMEKTRLVLPAPFPEPRSMTRPLDERGYVTSDSKLAKPERLTFVRLNLILSGGAVAFESSSSDRVLA